MNSRHRNSETGRLPKEARKRYALALLAVAAAGSTGNVMVKYGMDHIQVHSALGIFSSMWLDVGVFLLCVQFVALTLAFRWGPLSLTVPLRGASIYILTALLAIFFLGEQISLMRWAAIVVITIGITLIGISGGK